MALFPGKSFFVFARGLVPRLGEVLIAASAAATMRDQYALSRAGEIGNGRAGLVIEDERADRNLQDHVLTGMAGAVGAFAVAATIRLEFAILTLAEKRVPLHVVFQLHPPP